MQKLMHIYKKIEVGKVKDKYGNDLITSDPLKGNYSIMNHIIYSNKSTIYPSQIFFIFCM